MAYFAVCGGLCAPTVLKSSEAAGHGRRSLAGVFGIERWGEEMGQEWVSRWKQGSMGNKSHKDVCKNGCLGGVTAGEAKRE